jgi:hypothetical protein
MRALLILVIANLCAAPAFADGEQDAATLTRAGIMGTKWAIDCSKPASKSNQHFSYRVRADGVPVESYFARGREVERELRNVQPISSD